MSGPRVTSGADSRQDYATPRVFLDAVEKRFGPIVFDLAAHAWNHVVPRYFAPAEFAVKVERGKDDFDPVLTQVVRSGAVFEEAENALKAGWPVGNGNKATIRIRNRDPNAAALDAFAHDWKVATKDGLGFLNCEFGDITPWAKKSAQGGNLGLLTPASVGANWNRDHILGKADVYVLSGKNSRLCFDGREPYPKDCQFAHFHPNALGLFALWDWRRDELTQVWWPDKRGAALEQARLAL